MDMKLKETAKYGSPETGRNDYEDDAPLQETHVRPNNNKKQGTSAVMLKVILPLLFIALAAALVVYFKNNQPTVSRSGPPGGDNASAAGAPLLSVEIINVNQTQFQSTVNAFGQIEAVTRGQLVSQVAGEITEVSEQSAEGGIFTQGEVLIKIDDRDYKIALTSSKAMLASAQSTLLQEKARSEQAAIDWKRLGNEGPANDLVMRKPQLLSAQSDVESAQSGIERAELDIERTQIKAPYKGQVMERYVDLGQYVNKGEALLEIFALDKAEVKLPLNSAQLGLVDLSHPESHQVTVYADYGNQQYEWQANIVRTAGAFDEGSRQLSVIAQINNPFISETEKPALKVGQFIHAEIKAKTFENVYVLPAQTIYQNAFVLAVEDNKLVQKEVDIVYQDEVNIVVSNQTPLENVVTTPLGLSQIGKPVKIKGEVVEDGADGQGPAKQGSEAAQQNAKLSEQTADELTDYAGQKTAGHNLSGEAA